MIPLTLDYNPDSNRIKYDAGSCVGEYILDVDEGTREVIMLSVYQQVLNPEATVEHLLKECLAKAVA
jgi:hypothetical protein